MIRELNITQSTIILCKKLQAQFRLSVAEITFSTRPSSPESNYDCHFLLLPYTAFYT